MRALYGTTNEAKVNSMKKWLKRLDIEIFGLKEAGLNIPHIDEVGHTPLENAIIKAEAYYRQFNIPVFSCDSGLLIEGLAADEQPGIHVRRVGGRELSDEEMIQHYSQVVRKLGGSAKARYQNGICFVLEEGLRYVYDGEDIGYSSFLMVSSPHPKRVPGFPLDSLSVDIKTGRYYYDLDRENNTLNDTIDKGFENFFIRCGIKQL